MDTRKFFIKPQIPEKIKELEMLAQNVWSSWDKDARKLFHRLDPQLFRRINHNPVELLYRVSSERLNEMAKDKGFLYELKQVVEKYHNYMEFEGTYLSDDGEKTFNKEDVVVYTCMEYGLHESLPFYSGGLAVLAGDQLKAVSDVGCSMVSFGLLYAHGYFSQRIAPDGIQMEEYKKHNWALTAIREVVKEGGAPLIIEVPLKGEKVLAKVWKIEVGKVPLYLLDTNIHQNPEKFRNITSMLYDSNRQTRLEQEIVLGRGSVIALKALNIEPKVYHINEGHTAFLILERLIDLIKVKKYSFDEAKIIIQASTVFTTHTPVVEGNEHYDDELIKEYLQDEVRSIGLNINEFISMGKIGDEKMFWLPVFAMRFSRLSNGVSKIHGSVSREMWKDLYPKHHRKEIPISHVTNGVHLQTWLSLQMTEMFDRYIGPDYFHRADLHESWNNIYDIPDGEIWNAHCRRKEQVVSFIRRQVSSLRSRGSYVKSNLKDVEQLLNPDYLTIGFARRFAPYKRANLILSDPERLAALITNKEKPLQLVFAGKAHPADVSGKKIIKEIFDFISKYSLETKVVFIEDYDMNVARHLVQGVDVWLNTPVRPMEASGTSGMKAGINGVLNLSIADGWWPEAYDGTNGWMITAGDEITDPHLARTAEANQLYDFLENEIIEYYYNRADNNIPLEWVKMMKNSIITCCSKFNMHRAVREYLYNFYMPQMELSKKICMDNCFMLKKLNKFKKEIDSFWNKIFIRDYFTSIDGRMPISGEAVNVDCYVYLGDIDENLVNVELLYCHSENGEKNIVVPLQFMEKYSDKVAKYYGSVVLSGNGQQEISARVAPSDPDFRALYQEYVKWKE
ncbi:alpha-glucan family phosphorylase [bacterium]|nr:alpha-glucan family phosphorylase [bacterium]